MVGSMLTCRPGGRALVCCGDRVTLPFDTCVQVADIALLGVSVHGMVVDAAVLPRQRALRLLQIEDSAPSQALLSSVELCLPHLALLQVVEASVLGGAVKLHVRPHLVAAFCALLGARCSDASGHKQAVTMALRQVLLDPGDAHCTSGHTAVLCLLLIASVPSLQALRYKAV
jgi:hypothetical protein